MSGTVPPSRIEARTRTANMRVEREEPAPEVVHKRNARNDVPVVAPSLPPRQLGPCDPVVAATVAILVAFGLMMVYSASGVVAYARHENGQYFLFRQIGHAVVGFLCMAAAAFTDYRRLRALSYPALLGSIVLLALIAFGFGRSAGGAARWLPIGGVNVQPAEFAKLAMILWLSYSMAKKVDTIRTFSIGFLPHCLVAGLLIVLCLRQPDFGSAVIIALLTLGLLFISGARISYMLATALLLSPGIYHVVAGSEYRLRRIQAFLAPWTDRWGAGYQLVESFLSFGSGGIMGAGIGDGRGKFGYLPEAHTDFIGAIVAEELGFVGFTLMVVAYGVLIYRGIRIAMRAADDYGTYLAAGITLFLGLQTLINLGVALGLLPTKGLCLPFISYGGNALLVNCAAIGILLSVSRSCSEPEAIPSEPASTRSNSRVLQTGGMP